MQVPARKGRCVRFGRFRVDLASRELLSNGSKIPLQDKPFQVLSLLLDHAGELVSREEFRQKLWPSDTFVDFDHGINTAVKKLREALADEPDQPHFIETVPRHGYRFISPVATSSEAPKSRLQNARKPIVLLLIVLIGTVLVSAKFRQVSGWLRRSSERNIPVPIKSLAVLPLQNVSQNSSEEYFTDGLTDALITDLGKVAGLRVISHTSAMTYRKTAKPLPQIARELNVDAVVEGTVLRSGNRVRLTVQLVRASPEEHLWAERYERDVGDVIGLERRLALAIAHEVTGRVITAEEAGLAGKHPVNPKAYDAYLRGRYLWNERMPQRASEAVSYFEQALREDPNFAPAYSGLADHYSVGWGPWVDLTIAERYARKAVLLEPGLSEAHASLGVVSQYQGRFTEAATELKRAIELNPNYAMAHHWYAMHLLCMGHVNEALAENDRALRLDPFSVPINNMRAQILISMHEYKEAIEQAEKLAAITDANFSGLLARIYWLEGQGAKAIAEEQKAADSLGSGSLKRDLDLANVYVSDGFRPALLRAARVQAAACSNTSEKQLQSAFCDQYTIALKYSLLGEKDKAMYWLRRELPPDNSAKGVFLLIGLETAPEYDTLRSDKRFKALLAELGLPQ